MDTLKENVLYHDTDSVIFISLPNEPEPELGDYLGDLTSETDKDDHIVHFCSTGPKSYAYKTAKGEQCCKIKGFRLNYTNEKALNFDSMIELLTDENKDHINISSQKTCRHKNKRILYNRTENKKFKIVYTKRVIQKDAFTTLLYGY